MIPTGCFQTGDRASAELQWAGQEQSLRGSGWPTTRASRGYGSGRDGPSLDDERLLLVCFSGGKERVAVMSPTKIMTAKLT